MIKYLWRLKTIHSIYIIFIAATFVCNMLYGSMKQGLGYLLPKGSLLYLL